MFSTIWIAIDESGDLGFSEKSSKYLVLAFAFTLKPEYVRKKLKRLLKKLVRKKVWPKELHELKFSLSKTKLKERGIWYDKYISNLMDTRIVVLKEIRKLPIQAAVSIVEKRMVSNHLRSDPNKLYNYAMVHPLVIYFIPKYNPPAHSYIEIVLDKRIGSRAMEALQNYFHRKYDYMVNFEGRINYRAYFELHQKPSHLEPLIWVSDYIAGSINHYLVKKDSTYIDLIKEKLFSCLYFWKNQDVCKRILK
ncbi:MAG: DUF3800 domain-containing protein [Staphylothermus sp.]|nr:DUF3800 domain-containing protein [Staphylothermus sp.]